MSQAGQAYELFPGPSPLRGQLHLRENIGSYIGSGDLELIKHFLCHDGTFDGTLMHANGRNVTVPLGRPRSPLYDSVQISGGAYIPMGIESNADAQHSVVTSDASLVKQIYPPVGTGRQFTHSYGVIENGVLTGRDDKSPLGSYSQHLAERKLDMTARAMALANKHLIVPVVLGKHVYIDLPDGQGGKATALLFGVPVGGERTDSSFLGPLYYACQQLPEKASAALRTYLPAITDTMTLIGHVAHEIHEAGFVHNQLTLGNVLAIQRGEEQGLYVADWETTTVSEDPIEDIARLHDLSVAFRSFSGMVDTFPENADISDEQKLAILTEGLVVLLGGYYDLNPGEVIDFVGQDRQTLWSQALHTAYMGEEIVNDDALHRITADLKQLAKG